MMKGDLNDEGRIDYAVGQKIRQRRVALGMAQQVLGQSLGLTFQQVQKMESGKNRVGAGRLWQLAGILDVPISYFYGGLARQPAPDDPQGKTNHAAVDHFLGRREGQKMAGALYDMSPSIRTAIMRLITAIDEQGTPRP